MRLLKLSHADGSHMPLLFFAFGLFHLASALPSPMRGRFNPSRPRRFLCSFPRSVVKLGLVSYLAFFLPWVCFFFIFVDAF
jgi:hypothetical protein